MNIWELSGKTFTNFSDLYLVVIFEIDASRDEVFPFGRYQGYMVRPREKIITCGGRLELVSIFRHPDDYSVDQGEKDGQKGVWVIALSNGHFVLPVSDPRKLSTGPITYLCSNELLEYDYEELGEEGCLQLIRSVNGVFFPQKDDGSMPIEGIDFVVMGHKKFIEGYVDDAEFLRDEDYEEIWEAE